jgi:3-phenylpropionate/cinnamic acid dioxygenase small subunit
MPAMSQATLSQSRLDELLLKNEVEDLLYLEADLLDTRQYEQWLDLFTDDVRYWMPLRKNVPWRERGEDSSRDDEVGWFDDDKATLTKRVKQLLTGIHWAEEPISRVSHFVSNVRIAGVPDTAGHLPVTCRILVYRNRMETETDFLVARREDLLRRVDGKLKIAKRKILIEQSVLMAKNLTVFL